MSNSKLIDNINFFLIENIENFDEFKNYVKIIKDNVEDSKKILSDIFKKIVEGIDVNYDINLLLYLLLELNCDVDVTLLIKMFSIILNSEYESYFFEIELDKILYKLLKTDEAINIFLDSFVKLDLQMQSFIIETSFYKLTKINFFNKNKIDKICDDILSGILLKYENNPIHSPKKNIFDCSDEDSVISGIFDYYCDFQMVEKLPIIKHFYDKNIAHTRINGDYDDIVNMMLKLPEKSFVAQPKKFQGKLSKSQKKRNNRKQKVKNIKKQQEQEAIEKMINDLKEKKENNDVNEIDEEKNEILNDLNISIIDIYSKYPCYICNN